MRPTKASGLGAGPKNNNRTRTPLLCHRCEETLCGINPKRLACRCRIQMAVCIVVWLACRICIQMAVYIVVASQTHCFACNADPMLCRQCISNAMHASPMRCKQCRSKAMQACRIRCYASNGALMRCMQCRPDAMQTMQL